MPRGTSGARIVAGITEVFPGTNALGNVDLQVRHAPTIHEPSFTAFRKAF